MSNPGKLPTGRARVLAFVSVGIILALAGAVVYYWERVQGLGSYGYLGAFVISILGSATIIVPVPSLAVVFALGGVLKYPLLVGIAAGMGEPLGELTGYMAGVGGRKALKSSQNPLYTRVQEWMRRRGFLALFAMAAVPNPIFDLIGAAAGALRYPLWKFLLVCWAGKTVKGLMVSFAGAWGLQFVLRWLGFLG